MRGYTVKNEKLLKIPHGNYWRQQQHSGTEQFSSFGSLFLRSVVALEHLQCSVSMNGSVCVEPPNVDF